MRKKLNKMFALLLCIILVEGFFPASVFAGHDDGQDCPYCGHYHWDDYMCPDCGGCSAECTNSDCYEKNHCPECGVCRAEFGDDYFCPDCGLCYACATDDKPNHLLIVVLRGLYVRVVMYAAIAFLRILKSITVRNAALVC